MWVAVVQCAVRQQPFGYMDRSYRVVNLPATA